MPTYDYRCKSCGYEFEAFQAMSDAPLKECPECQGTVQRLIGGGAGLIFKGSGFYVNDSKNKGPKKDGSAPKATEKGSEKAPAKTP
jgi:putative FmdB family regulatory protein